MLAGSEIIPVQNKVNYDNVSELIACIPIKQEYLLRSRFQIYFLEMRTSAINTNIRTI